MGSLIKNPYSEQDVSQMFDTISHKYDFLNSLLSLNQDKRWRKKLLEMVPTQKNGGTFLDVATGTGDVLIACEKAKKVYSQYIGVDISEKMLAMASEKIKKENLSATLKVMSAERLGFEENSVDCLTISFGLRNVNNRERGLQEFVRLLKKNGTLIILEFFLPPKKILSRFFLFYFRNILPKIGGLFANKSAYTYLPDSLETFGTPEKIIKSLSSCGAQLTHSNSFIFGSCRLLVFKKS